MNKLILAFACCTLSLATMTPATSFAQAGTPTKMEKTMMKDGSVIMKGGKMMVMKDNKWMPMMTDMTMKNGTKVMKDGTVMMKDGKKTMLKEGQSVAPDGMVDRMKM